MEVDLERSIDQIEGEVWPEPTLKSHLAMECYRLRKIPLSEFRTENLRILIGQKIALHLLVPLAIDTLEEDLFAEGMMYKGDLLHVVSKLPNSFWVEHVDLNNRIVELRILIEELYSMIRDEILPALQERDYLP